MTNYHELFKGTPQLRNLELYIDLRKLCDFEGYSYAEAGSRSQMSAENIVHLMVPSRVNGQQPLLPPKRLSTLRLHGFNLSIAAHALRDSVDLQALEELSLQKCEDELRLLSIMTGENENARAALRRLEILRDERKPSGSDETQIFDKFLVSFDTLESLILHAPASYNLMPKFQSILSHKAQLRSLYLHFDVYDEMSEDLHEVMQPVKYLSYCDKLEQLAMDFRDIFLGGWMSNDEIVDLLVSPTNIAEILVHYP